MANSNPNFIPGQRERAHSFEQSSGAQPVRTTPRPAGALPNLGSADRAGVRSSAQSPARTASNSAQWGAQSPVRSANNSAQWGTQPGAQLEPEVRSAHPSEIAGAAQHRAVRTSTAGSLSGLKVVGGFLGGILDGLATPRHFVRSGVHPRPSPAKIAILSIGGLALWIWGGFVTFLWMQATFPALKGSLGGNTFTLIGTIAVSVLFLVVELWVWEGGHSWLVILGIVLPALASDIYINIGGYKTLFGVEKLVFWNDSTTFLILIGALNALVPEKVMSAAWKTK